MGSMPRRRGHSDEILSNLRLGISLGWLMRTVGLDGQQSVKGTADCIGFKVVRIRDFVYLDRAESEGVGGRPLP
jgi:hypothetical protein